MARDGYIEARRARNAAADYVAEKQAELDGLGDSQLPPELLEIRHKVVQKLVEDARLTLVEAEAAFALFKKGTKERVKTRVKHFDVRINVCVSLDSELHALLIEKQRTESISVAEIIRRGLRVYLEKP